MLHHCGEHKSGDKGDGQRVGHCLVMLLERIFKDVQPQTLVKVLEENASQMVSLFDDDGIFLAQFVQIGESRSEHRVGRHVAEPAVLVKLFQVGLHGSDVADDAVLRQHGEHLPERVERIFYRSGVDDQFGLEFLDFLDFREAVTVVHEPQALRIDVIYGHFVLKAQHVGKEGAHFPGSQDQYSHFNS